MGPFQGGIWDSSPFGRRDGGEYRSNQPQRGGCAEQDPYGDYGSPPPVMGNAGPVMHQTMGYDGPMTGGNSHSYSSYQDSDDAMYEEGYGPNGPYRNSMRGSRGPRSMGMVIGGRGMPPQGRPPSGSLRDGRPTGRPGAFQSAFWTGSNPFRTNGANGGVNGRAEGGQGSHPDSALRNELDPAPMRQDRGLSQEAADDTMWFMQERTQPVGDGGSAPPNAECPICLEPPGASHLCVQIKGIEGCNHMIGRNCLKEMLLNRPGDKKRCPICRAEFLGEDGVWQDSEQFQQLANGQNAGGRAPSYGPPPGYGGGPPQAPSSYGGTPRATPLATPHAAPPGLRNAMRGGARVHGMGDVGMGRNNDEQDGGHAMGGMQGGPPMMDDRGPPSTQSNFNGRGERLSYMYPDQRW